MTKPHHYCHLVSLTLLLSLAVGPAVADTLIIDSKSSPARYQEGGGSWNSGGQGMNGDYRWFSGDAAKAQVTYTPGVTGRRAVEVCWGVDSNHTPGLKYMVDLDGNIATTNDQTTIPVDNRLPATQQPAAASPLAVTWKVREDRLGLDLPVGAAQGERGERGSLGFDSCSPEPAVQHKLAPVFACGGEGRQECQGEASGNEEGCSHGLWGLLYGWGKAAALRNTSGSAPSARQAARAFWGSARSLPQRMR